MRKNDISDLFVEVHELIVILKALENKAINNNAIVALWNPKIKSAFEHLRTALDYSTRDINYILNVILKSKNELLNPDEINFPYGNTFQKFNSNVGKLKGLKKYMPDVYDLIESLQPFKSGNHWLTYFIEVNNNMKHHKAAVQIRLDSTSVALESNACGTTDATNGQIIFENCTLNGISTDGTLEIKDGRVVSQPTNVSVDIIEKTEFVFKESNAFIIKTIQKTYFGITDYINKLYQILENEYKHVSI